MGYGRCTLLCYTRAHTYTHSSGHTCTPQNSHLYKPIHSPTQTSSNLCVHTQAFLLKQASTLSVHSGTDNSCSHWYTTLAPLTRALTRKHRSTGQPPPQLTGAPWLSLRQPSSDHLGPPKGPRPPPAASLHPGITGRPDPLGAQGSRTLPTHVSPRTCAGGKQPRASLPP